MDEKEVLHGYVIDSHIWVGHKRICFGIAEDQTIEFPYMMCVYESEGYMYPVCDKLHCFDNFPEAVHAYANKISESAKELEDRRAAIVGVDDPSCLKAEDVVDISWEDSIKGKVVAVKERSLTHGYEDVINKRLIPALGEYEMEELTPMILQRYIVDLSQKGNTKTGKGLAPNSVSCIILVLHSSLSMAYVLGLTKEIHVDKIKRPKTSEKPIESFTKAEQKIIEQAVLADKRDKMFGIILCLYTGLRIGELLALEWSDIDFTKAELSVTKSCYDGQDENGKSCRITGTPKTESSKRTIPIPKQIIPHLREIKKRSTSKYVVGNGSKIITVRSYQRSFELLLQKQKISHHGFHALRHTFATRAIECGMDVKSLSEILGHKNPTITLKRYVHSFMEHKREYMNRLGKLF